MDQMPEELYDVRRGQPSSILGYTWEHGIGSGYIARSTAGLDLVLAHVQRKTNGIWYAKIAGGSALTLGVGFRAYPEMYFGDMPTAVEACRAVDDWFICQAVENVAAERRSVAERLLRDLERQAEDRRHAQEKQAAREAARTERQRKQDAADISGLCPSIECRTCHTVLIGMEGENSTDFMDRIPDSWRPSSTALWICPNCYAPPRKRQPIRIAWAIPA